MFVLETSACTSASVLATILFIKKLIKILSIIVPAILILLLSIDFAKAVIAGDDDEIKRAQHLALKRLIYGAIVFFIPMIVNVTFGLLDSKDVSKSCFSNATQDVVDVLTQAENEKLLEYQENRNKLIEAAKIDKDQAKKAINELRQKEITKPSSNNNNNKTLELWFNALEEQYKWAKNSKYAWVSDPTIANSKYKGTCVTYVVVSLQRAKIIPEGKNIIAETNGVFYINSYGKSYIKKHPDLLSYSYVNSTPKKLYNSGKLKPGDIVTFKFDPHGHTMVFVGKDKNGNFLWDTGGSTKCINCKMNSYLNRTVNIIIRIKGLD